MADTIQVVGLDEFRRELRKAEDATLPKRLGQVNKKIGEMVVDRLVPSPTPLAVGQGVGAAVRPSASQRDVILRAGGAHRDRSAPFAVWGKSRVAGRRQPVPHRPFIKKTAEAHHDEMAEAWLEAVHDSYAEAFDG